MDARNRSPAQEIFSFLVAARRIHFVFLYPSESTGRSGIDWMLAPWKQFLHQSRAPLAYWYFRLNGFMTIMNFVVHRDRGPGQETDADVLGVRFPHRAEGPPEDPMADDEHLLRVYSKRTAASKRPYVIIAEVTKQRCKLNGPWTNRGRGNMQRVLAAIGAIEEAEREQAATALYGPGVYENKDIYMSLCCLGNRESGHIASGRPDVPQIVWGHVATFIYRRFDTHFETKRSHPQWDGFGQHLWRLRE